MDLTLNEESRGGDVNVCVTCRPQGYTDEERKQVLGARIGFYRAYCRDAYTRWIKLRKSGAAQ